MPPRLLPDSYGFVDTLAKYPTFWSFNSGAVSKISNQFAAMPSVHCCWATLVRARVRAARQTRWAKVLAIVYPVVTLTVIVLTANHYFLDAVGGFVVLGIGWVVAAHFTACRRGGRSGPRRCEPRTCPARDDRYDLDHVALAARRHRPPRCASSPAASAAPSSSAASPSASGRCRCSSATTTATA